MKNKEIIKNTHSKDLSIDPKDWEGSSVHSESTFHQLAPFIGKMKSSMARSLIDSYTSEGATILDPFMGSGTIGLECVSTGRSFVGADVNPYAIVLSRAKLSAPKSLEEAEAIANSYLDEAESAAPVVDLGKIPFWVRDFFNPITLKEIIALRDVLNRANDPFIMSCLLGILHHQRPGFLSYPSSHLVPYLRDRKFPREDFPDLYAHRPVRPRLIKKIRRAYRRPSFSKYNTTWSCLHTSSALLELEPKSIDSVITSPPYMNALDYARDNRLRMWLLGFQEYRHYDFNLNTPNRFENLMEASIQKIARVLKPDGLCVLVVGEAQRNSRLRIEDGARRRERVVMPNADMVTHLATEVSGKFEHLGSKTDTIPDVRRARRKNAGTKGETIILLRRKL